MNLLINFLTKTRLLRGDLDYHLVGGHPYTILSATVRKGNYESN